MIIYVFRFYYYYELNVNIILNKMQTFVTIPSGIKDPTYRYKMPKMNLKEESRLNGVKTNIVNIEEVALALRVPSISIMKFMSSELGANME
jgi:hypothetical protein